MNDNKAAIRRMLERFAEEHLQTMARVPWSAYAESIQRMAPRPAGETFGCEESGIYFDIGDTATWLTTPGGDVHLVAHAACYPDGGAAQRTECSTVIRRP